MATNLNLLYKICSFFAVPVGNYVVYSEDPDAMESFSAQAGIAKAALPLLMDILDGNEDSPNVDLACRSLIEAFTINDMYEQGLLEEDQYAASLGTSLLNEGRLLRCLTHVFMRTEEDKARTINIDQGLIELDKEEEKHLKSFAKILGYSRRKISEDMEKETFFLHFGEKTKDIHTYAELVKRFGKTGYYSMHCLFSLGMHPLFLEGSAKEKYQKQRKEYIDAILQEVVDYFSYVKKDFVRAYPSYSALKAKTDYSFDFWKYTESSVKFLLDSPHVQKEVKWWLGRTFPLLRSVASGFVTMDYHAINGDIRMLMELNAYINKLRERGDIAVEEFMIASVSNANEVMDLEQENQDIKSRITTLYNRTKPECDKALFSKNIRSSIRYCMYEDDDVSFSKIIKRYLASGGFSTFGEEDGIDVYIASTALGHASFGRGAVDVSYQESLSYMMFLGCAVDTMVILDSIRAKTDEGCLEWDHLKWIADDLTHCVIVNTIDMRKANKPY